jgi:hypothetical protein
MKETEEIVFMSDHNVKVTQSRLIIKSNKTYAMRNISSVHTHKIPKKTGFQWLMIIGGAIIAIAGDGEGLIPGIILLILGAFWLSRLKDRYALRIQSSSGRSDGLTSKDKNYIDEMVRAINEAIIYRG